MFQPLSSGLVEDLQFRVQGRGFQKKQKTLHPKRKAPNPMPVSRTLFPMASLATSKTCPAHLQGLSWTVRGGRNRRVSDFYGVWGLRGI